MRNFQHASNSGCRERTVGLLSIKQDGFVICGPSGSRNLTVIERALLMTLCQSPAGLVYSTELLEKVWGPAYKEDSHLLHDSIARLRKALASVGVPRNAIQTLHGIGYMLTRTTEPEAVFF